MIGGQRDVAYADIDADLPRATEEGQQIFLEGEADVIDDEPRLLKDDDKALRPAGKLYGTSLIDDLETRKALMRTKQRVFTGDNRPSMMNRSSTLIDPASLQTKPNAQRMSSYGSLAPGLSRRNSTGAKPLLNFDEGLSPPSNIPKNRSVFGVDTLWQREMVKLKEIEAQEKREAEDRERIEEEERARKGKNKGKQREISPLSEGPPDETKPQPRVSIDPPVLPAIQSTIRRVPIDDDSDSDNSDVPQRRQTLNKNTWNAGSSDEEEPRPRRTTGVGPRYTSHSSRPAVQNAGEDDSDEELPLAATLKRAAQLKAIRDQESDEESQPLAVVLQQARQALPTNKSTADSDDDNEPLGLRAVRPSQSMQNDDDQPLAFHPEQQRRAQSQMMAQQQMLMQAQIHNSMFFNPSMMGSGFFAPAISPAMMMQAPIRIPSPPPLHDPTKFGRVDQWRHDVAST